MAAELFAGGIHAPHSGDMVKSVEAAHDGAAAFALQGMGTTFIKLGQFLATRPDIIGEELSAKLENLQDRLPPFSINQAKEIIRKDKRVLDV